MQPTDGHTDTQTDHTTPSVVIGHIQPLLQCGLQSIATQRGDGRLVGLGSGLSEHRTFRIVAPSE